ncbi:unnamed protein product [Arctia plantaginis]|uniref:Uncharacterized protein n=1 Tax=Arctia plantaginis TaxID=874455 RepID=A0A8S1BRL5_ARCPL|nr:unnamed protein product [Arctia plantaginis]
MNINIGSTSWGIVISRKLFIIKNTIYNRLFKYVNNNNSKQAIIIFCQVPDIETKPRGRERTRIIWMPVVNRNLKEAQVNKEMYHVPSCLDTHDTEGRPQMKWERARQKRRQ